MLYDFKKQINIKLIPFCKFIKLINKGVCDTG